MMKRRRHRPLRIVLTLATITFVVAWALLLRPQALGGPAAYVIVSGKSMEPRLHTGDLVILVEESSYEVGDVIAYNIPEGQPGEGAFVIHRIIGGSARDGFATRGDNRERRDLWRPTPRETLGTMRFSIPRVGLLFTFIRTPFGIALAAGLAAFLFISGGWKTNNSRSRDCPYARAAARRPWHVRLRRVGRPLARSSRHRTAPHVRHARQRR
jgi:signal peptidase